MRVWPCPRDCKKIYIYISPCSDSRDLWHYMTQAEIVNKLFISKKRCRVYYPSTDRLNHQGLEIHFAYLWRSKVQNLGCLSGTKPKQKKNAGCCILSVVRFENPPSRLHVRCSVPQYQQSSSWRSDAGTRFSCFSLLSSQFNLPESLGLGSFAFSTERLKSDDLSFAVIYGPEYVNFVSNWAIKISGSLFQSEFPTLRNSEKKLFWKKRRSEKGALFKVAFRALTDLSVIRH